MSPLDSGVKRAFDIVVAAAGLVVLSPVMALVAALLRLTTSGPVLHRAARVGRCGRSYTMHKFRTMRYAPGEQGARITGTTDERVVAVGRLLRRTKLDELPQLWDVLRGAMSVVGPRPEDPDIVRDHYTPAMLRTLNVRPGLTSPGSIFGTTHAMVLLDADDPETAYVERMLPVKLALELVYLERQSFWYDLRIIGRTMTTIAWMLVGRHEFPDPPEMEVARRLLGTVTGSSGEP